MKLVSSIRIASTLAVVIAASLATGCAAEDVFFTCTVKSECNGAANADVTIKGCEDADQSEQQVADKVTSTFRTEQEKLGCMKDQSSYTTSCKKSDEACTPK